ncbi:MAG: hypothetical protein ACI8W8_001179 [Rhodothermales bacterium]|jgi:hypothetical protein
MLGLPQICHWSAAVDETGLDLPLETVTGSGRDSAAEIEKGSSVREFQCRLDLGEIGREGLGSLERGAGCFWGAHFD